jgi:hypothetical protein|tara:strand:- start:220 stop:432 length:213 start_codon:yes stop_codon:yes gene_type:complete
MSILDNQYLKSKHGLKEATPPITDGLANDPITGKHIRQPGSLIHNDKCSQLDLDDSKKATIKPKTAGNTQ